MIGRRLIILLAICSFSIVGLAQKTTVFTDANLVYKQGIELYDKGVIGPAQQKFKEAMELLQVVNEPEYQLLKTKSQLYYAKCAVRLDSPEGEKLILAFSREHAPDPLANQAILEMADYYYNAKNYDKAIELFSKIPSYDLNKEQRTELRFKQAYSLFVKKKFTPARGIFQQIKDTPGEFYNPSNYYYGMTSFFANNYDDAVKSFRKVERVARYRPHIPYYVCQIYFAEANYDQLLSYAVPKVNESGLRHKTEINQLIGQSYFEKGQYSEALPYLEYYADRSSKMRQEDLYQLGFAQHKTQRYKSAIKSLEQLKRADSKLGQNAMYLLADCQLKTGNKSGARNAFKEASRLNYDLSLQEEALYNYAKLSYELKFDREAVTALQQIKPSSPYHTEAQTMLSSLFLNTRDYARAMSIIENLPNKTPKMRETYQRVAFYRGLQLYGDGNVGEAKRYLNKSLEVPIDTRTKALAVYWLGEIAHKEKNYNESDRQLSNFLGMARTMNRLPDEASVYTANYTQGYNFLKQKKYNEALGYFQGAVGGIKRNAMFITNDYVKTKVLGDAILRAGDCYFKQNKYNDAIKFYNDAIQNRYAGFVYALYQKAVIEGLRGNTTEKILALENITEDFPRSEYTDEALLQLGVTYQEIGKFDQATRPLKKLITQFKGRSELINQGLLRLGLISYNQGNLQESIRYYKDVFNNNPEANESQAALAALREIYVDDLGKPDEYFRFLESIPGYEVEEDERETINFTAAESQFENGNYDKAVDAYTRYLRKYPNGANNLLAHFHRGESYSVLKNYTKALADYDFVINKGQSKYYVKSLKKAAIISYNHEENFNTAYNYYVKLENAATNETTKFDAQLGALRSAYRINNPDAVYNLAAKVINNPASNDDQKAAANFYLGKMAFDRKDYDRSLSSLNQVVRLSDNEETAESRYLIAYIYYLRRDLEIAQQLCMNANKESSSYPYWVAKSVILLADILAEKGDEFNAQAVLEGLLENYNEDPDLVNEAKAKLARLKARSDANSRLDLTPDNGNTLELIEDQ